MRFIITAILFLGVFSSAIAQEKLKKIKYKFEDLSNRGFTYQETYFVLASDDEIRHGSYMRKQGTNTLAKGVYVNNLKEGMWGRYNKGGELLEKGSYSKGQKVGVWEYFNDRGELITKYNHSDSTLVYHKPPSPMEGTYIYFALVEGEYTQAELDTEPIFIGGSSRMFRAGIIPMAYPRYAQRMGIEGIVKISLVVTKEGKLIDETIESSVGGGLEEEVLRTFLEIPDEWIPATLNGAPVTVKFTQNVVFQFAN